MSLVFEMADLFIVAGEGAGKAIITPDKSRRARRVLRMQLPQERAQGVGESRTDQPVCADNANGQVRSCSNLSPTGHNAG